jgi:hypothetical protein
MDVGVDAGVGLGVADGAEVGLGMDVGVDAGVGLGVADGAAVGIAVRPSGGTAAPHAATAIAMTIRTES